MKKIVISKDVIFYKENTWNWNDQQPSQTFVDTEIEFERQQPLDQQTQATLELVSSPNDAPTTTKVEVIEPRPSRIRRRLAWMGDFEVTSIGPTEDPIIHFTGLTELSEGQKTIGVKWVYKTKLKENGEVDKYKARLVAKGYKQEFWVDYKEVFALVASRIEAYFLKVSFTKCPYKSTLFIKTGNQEKMLIVSLYVDDLIFTGNYSSMFNEFKKSMMIEFEMSNLSMMHYFLGIKVVQSADGIFISQRKYVQDILNRFDMKDCNLESIPIEFGLKLRKEGKKVNSTFYKQIIGSLMYLTGTRPDITYSVSLISRFMENPIEMHLLAVKRILRYLQGTKDFRLFYRKCEISDLFGFIDSDFAGDLDDRKSTSSYVFMMGTGVVSWSSRNNPLLLCQRLKLNLLLQ
ncbi:hypothetical protein CXB51_027230 [Gossypium anomalum]|uniref:Reverse transcriptase Ty1/copia-type domain-containing protein n=1 Tax=Gossypium anomalum TaxID=47600 RepID=A0A8J5YHX8_9ROSI|nr:hypothetical protein CXB51_027230 [Gossypium anomalum]